MTKLYVLPFLSATLLLFAACNHKPTLSNNLTNVVEDTISCTETVIEHVEETKEILKFEAYIAQGFAISRSIKIYNEEMNYLQTMEMGDTITTFQIEEKTSKMYLSLRDEDCSRAYFLKIKIDDNVFIVSGSQIYTYANKDHIYKDIHHKNESYSLYAIKPFTVGASDEDGLTGCDDYKTLIIENEKTGSLHFIEGQRNDYYADKDNIKHYYLRTDDGIGESIVTVLSTMPTDYIQAHIDVVLQEGSAAYYLLITERDGTFHWQTANEVKYKD